MSTSPAPSTVHPTGVAPSLPPARRYAPELVLACGCLIGLLTFGPRASLGLFQIPVATDFGWNREVFSFAVAIQNLLWGVGQPFAGALADRFGTVRVLILGALLYAAGLAVMSVAATPGTMTLGTGVLIGFGLSGCSFNLVIGAFGKVLPERWRGLAFGMGTAAGSFGQFLFPPIGSLLIQTLGWQQTALVLGLTMLAVVPLSIPLATRSLRQQQAAGGEAAPQSLRQALGEAFGHRSYVFLVLGFFTCGFQLAFVTAHLPAYLQDLGMPAWVGGWTIAVIGLANAVGSLASGYLSTRMPKRWLLSAIYLARSAVVVVFLLLPPSPATALGFGVAMGLLWLSTVPPTSSLVMLMFGTRHMSMLYGFAFFSHQVGGFLGVFLGGFLYERWHSYVGVWWLSVLLGILSAIINLPIVEKPVARPLPASAAP